MTDALDIESLLAAVQALVAEVGYFQCSRFRRLPPGCGDAKGRREYVSSVDLESEQRLIHGLHQLLPAAGIYGEETGKQGDQRCCWIIDPLDGTTNFLSGLDQFSISVALMVADQVVLGVVYKPMACECFAGLRGGEFVHNGVAVAPDLADLGLEQALIGTGFPYRSTDTAGAFFHCAAQVLPASRGIRRMGSAALDLSYVAAGFLQGFWEADLQPYDVAAAVLFLELSGCVLTNGRGEPYHMGQDRMLVCGWPSVHRQLLALVQQSYPFIDPPTGADSSVL